MPKSLSETHLREVTGRVPAVALGAAWGGIAGAVIGMGISLAVGLFYTSAATLIFTVITLSSLFGAILGYVIASLLEGDVIYTARLARPHYTPRNAAQAGVPCDHKTLKNQPDESPETLALPPAPQTAATTLSAIRTTREVLLQSYHPDEKLFNLIVAASQKTECDTVR